MAEAATSSGRPSQSRLAVDLKWKIGARKVTELVAAFPDIPGLWNLHAATVFVGRFQGNALLLEVQSLCSRKIFSTGNAGRFGCDSTLRQNLGSKLIVPELPSCQPLQDMHWWQFFALFPVHIHNSIRVYFPSKLICFGNSSVLEAFLSSRIKRTTAIGTCSSPNTNRLCRFSARKDFRRGILWNQHYLSC